MKRPAHSSLERLYEFQKTFVSAIFYKQPVLLQGAFVPIVIFISILVFSLAQTREDAQQRRKIRLAGYFIVASAFAYIVQMYLLYLAAFRADEYLRLASYERYMGTFILSIMLFATFLYYDSGAWKKHVAGSHVALVLLFGYLLFFQPTVFSQALPGARRLDPKYASGKFAAMRLIDAKVPQDAKTYVINQGNWAPFKAALVFFANPRNVYVGKIDSDLASEQLHGILKDFDYLYFAALDEPFIDKYSGVFEPHGLLKNDAIYKITGSEAGVIALEGL